MSEYIQHNQTVMAFDSSESWVILSPIELSIKRKIESVGVPLKKWDINIYRGILTGFNEAFIISGEKKDELIAADPKSAEIIRPILRGRDIKRYSYTFADLWLIATFPSRQYNIDDYPAVRDYLLTFGIERLEQTGKSHKINGETVKSRKKTSNQWFETQDSISYWDDFSKQKIVWARLSRISKNDFYDFPRFSLVNSNYFVVDSLCFFTGNNLDKLVHMLNSEFSAYYFFNTVAILDTGGMQMRQQYVENIPLPVNISFEDKSDYESINLSIYEAFNFTEDEITYIKDYLKEKKEEISATH